MTCSDQQNKFVRADNLVVGPGFDLGDEDYTGKNVTMVKNVTYFVTEQFAIDLYDSCKNVQFPAVSDTIMFMLCGPWGSHDCTPRRWFEFLGSVDNNYAPFNIIYSYDTDNDNTIGYQYHNPEVISCQDTSPGYSEGCGCANCPAACTGVPPVINTDVAPYDFKLGGHDGLALIMGLVFVVGSVLFVGFSIVCAGPAIPAITPNAKIGPKIGTNIINAAIERFFTWWGKFAAKHPVLVLLFTLTIAFGLCFGVLKLEVTTDPIELWASPTSRSRVEKDFFDSEFRPFYRTAIIIFKAIENPEAGIEKFNFTDKFNHVHEFGAMFNKKFLKEVINLQHKIENITFEYEETEGNTETYDLTKVCMKPLDPLNANCSINSAWSYWQDNISLIDVTDDTTDAGRPLNYLDHFLDCVKNPSITPQGDSMGMGCLAKWGGPVNPYYVLGGFIPEGEAFPKNPEYEKSEAIVMQIIINNFDPHSEKEEDMKGIERAMKWEEQFVKFMKHWTENEMPKEYMDVAFTSERSVEDELDRETYGDVATIAVSYIIMFLYITLALGQYSKFSLAGFMIESKITLGLFGVMIVLLSVFSSIGIFALVGVPATLIIFEIIPFLVLAVGVDNIFILVQTFQRDQKRPTETDEEQVGRVVGQVAPSMLLSSLSESTCFFLGALSGMPAVRAFALYAGMALLIDFLLQVTCFVALMSLDMARQRNNKFDILCCIQGSKKSTKPVEGVLYRVFEHFYAPFLLSKWVRPVIMLLFFGAACSSIAVVPRIGIGLDQELSMPEDSFVLKFFVFMKDYLSVGPPVYFVLNNTAGHLDLSDHSDQNLLCLGLSGCAEDSLAGQVNSWSLQPEKSYIATAPMNWVEDYVSWVKTPQSDTLKCCRFYKNTTKFCPSEESRQDECEECINIDMIKNDTFRPDSEQFSETIYWFLHQNPGESCPKAGHGAFADSLKLNQIEQSVQLDESIKYEVASSNFMAFHTILRTSEDYYTALKRTRELTDSITERINANRPQDKQVNVFPYSIFYVFYEQYLTMWKDTLISVGISISTIFVVTFLLMGFDLHSAIIILLVIILILINLGAMMYWWNITLNAVSLVNIVMAVGISVEFCSHITRYFATHSHEDRIENARDSVIKMGSSVLSGITLTKFGGIIVLGFAKSKIFTVFYFRYFS